MCHVMERETCQEEMEGEPLNVKVLSHREEVLERGKTIDAAVITCGL